MLRKPIFSIALAMLAVAAVSCRKDVNTVDPEEPSGPETPAGPETPVDPGNGGSGEADNFRLVKCINFDDAVTIEFTYDNEGRVVKFDYATPHYSYGYEYEYVDKALIDKSNSGIHVFYYFDDAGFMTNAEALDSETDEVYMSIDVTYNSDGYGYKAERYDASTSVRDVIDMQWENGDIVGCSVTPYVYDLIYSDTENNTNFDFASCVSQVGFGLLPFRTKGMASRHLLERWTDAEEGTEYTYNAEYQLDEKGSPVQIDLTATSGEDVKSETITITYVD